jgi:hypothetical protein
MFLGFLFASAGANPQGALGQGILDAWTLVSVEGVRDDGTKSEPFGPKPKGITIFSPGGCFSLFQSRADVPKLAANDREKATPEEAKAVIAGAIAYYGTYSVNEADKALSVRLEASTCANLVGGEQNLAHDGRAEIYQPTHARGTHPAYHLEARAVTPQFSVPSCRAG